MVAMAALFDVAAKSGRTAKFDRAQRPQLFQRQPMRATVSRPMATDNVGQFNIWP
jgi:hypothetical protein